MYISRKSMTQIFIILVLVATTPTVYSQALKNPDRTQTAGSPVEEFSFLIKDFRMDHQGQANNLTISISYRYIANILKPDYPDFRWLAKDIETLLASYPNEDDYWEIVNKQITALLLKKYQGIAAVSCEIRVDPTSVVPYTRSSRVTRERSGGQRKRKHH
jgi:hypothetical protein